MAHTTAGAPQHKAQRDRLILALAADEHPIREIAARVTEDGFPVSKSQVQRVVAVWLNELAQDTRHSTKLLRARMLARHAHFIREAAAAWERSKAKAVKTTMRQSKKSKATGDLSPEAVAALPNTSVEFTKHEEHQVGDPRFLTIMQQGEIARGKLLGLEAPNKHALTDASGDHDLAEVFDGFDPKTLAALSRAAADVLDPEAITIDGRAHAMTWKKIENTPQARAELEIALRGACTCLASFVMPTCPWHGEKSPSPAAKTEGEQELARRIAGAVDAAARGINAGMFLGHGPYGAVIGAVAGAITPHFGAGGMLKPAPNEQIVSESQIKTWIKGNKGTEYPGPHHVHVGVDFGLKPDQTFIVEMDGDWPTPTPKPTPPPVAPRRAQALERIEPPARPSVVRRIVVQADEDM